MVASKSNLWNNQSADCPVLSKSCDNFISTKSCALLYLDKPIKYFHNTSCLTTDDSNKPLNIYHIYINRSLKQYENEGILEKELEIQSNHKFSVTEHNKKKF